MSHDIALCWHGTPAPDAEPQIVEELRGLLDSGLGCPGDLMIHNVFLGEVGNKDDPMIEVWGVEGDHRFHCEYFPDGEGVLTIDMDDVSDELRDAIARITTEDTP